MKRATNRIIDFRYAPAVQQTCIGFVDDFYKTIVREDGSLNYLWESDQNQFIDGTVPPCTKRVLSRQEGNLAFKYRFVPRFFHRDTLTSRTQDFGDPREALVRTAETYTHTDFEWTAFAHRLPDGTRMDILLFTLSARSGFGHARSIVYLQALGDSADPPHVERDRPSAYALPVGQPKLPPPVALYTPIERDGTRLAQDDLILREGDTWSGAFALVYQGHLEPADFTLVYATDALAQTQAYWQQVRPFRKAFRIPDEQIQAMLDACGRNTLQAREVVRDVIEYRVGPTIYRGLWVLDGYYFLECAHMMGRDEEAMQGLLAVLARVKPDGSIRILPDHHKETGVALSTIVRFCELQNDDARLRELWPTMQRGLAHLVQMQQASLALGPDYPAYGLFPPSFGDGGIYGPEPEYTTPMNVIVGLMDAYRAGKRLNLDGYGAFKALADTLHEHLARCIARDHTATADGIPYLPISMASAHTYTPQAGIQTIARVVFHGAFPPDGPLAQDAVALLTATDHQEGIPEATGWRPDQSLYTYASVRFAQLMLLTDQPEKAVDYLYAFANHASPARIWREEQPLRDTHGAEMCGDMPHNWASVEFIRMVRNLLVLESEDGLDLLPGLPPEWLPTPGNPLVLEATPTRFGHVSLSLELHGETQYTLTLSTDAGNQPAAWMTLHWPGAVKTAEGDLPAQSPGRFALPPLQASRSYILTAAPGTPSPSGR